MHHELSVRENELGPNVYSGTERHMANIIAGHFKCCLLRYLRGILGANSNFGFSVRKKCVIVLSSLTHQFWVSHADPQSVSPAFFADSAAAPLPPVVLTLGSVRCSGSCCSAELPRHWPHLHPRVPPPCLHSGCNTSHLAPASQRLEIQILLFSLSS